MDGSCVASCQRRGLYLLGLLAEALFDKSNSVTVDRAVLCVRTRTSQTRSKQLAKTSKKRKRVAWTKKLHAELRNHSKARTPVAKISKQMKRTVGALRQQALKLGIGLGHQR
jgi:hypothetical protein